MRPLQSIRVIDFGQYLAGPLVGMMLADMGAEVIRIDPPGGPKFEDPAFDMLSRGKSALTLDLKTKDGVNTALELIKRADVVIENFRPGVMDRLGLGPEKVRTEHPHLIYLSLPGFASGDEELAGLPGWEAVVAARTGQFTDMGLNRRLMGIKASFSPLTLASAYAASYGAMAILFALYARDTQGGDHIEVPLASALFEGLVYNSEQIEEYPDRYKSPRELELDRLAGAGESPDLDYAELSEFLDPFYRTYRCQDGRGFYVVSGSVAGHPQRVLKTLGLGEMLEDLPDFSPYLDTEDWPEEWTLNNYPVGKKDRARISQAMSRAFLTKPSHQWDELFGEAKAPATAQRTTKEWLNDPHALASGLIVTVDDPRFGAMRQLGNVAWLSGDEQSLDKKPGPLSDDARDRVEEILLQPIREFKPIVADRGWLEGLKVLDFTNVIAGPTIGSTLVRYGAEVTLVQPVKPSVDPWNAVVFGIHAHRGKENILLDIRSETGAKIVNKLIADAEVITINATDQQVKILGLTIEQLHKINPKLILVQLDAFGGPARGPKSDHLGYDDLAQAATGIMVRFGGGMETPEEHAHAGTIDVLAGLTACVALGGALVQRNQTQRGDVARTSLAAAGNMIQAQFMYDYRGRAGFDEPAGREALGWDAFYHCYEAADGWLFFAAPTDRHAVFEGVTGLEGLIDEADDVIATRLARCFRQQPVEYWQKKLCRGSSAVVPLASLLTNRDTSLQIESEGEIDITRTTYRAVRHDAHPMGRWCDLVAPNAVRPEKSKITLPGPAPKYGQHTREILQRLGFEAEEISALIENGIAATSWSEKYLPV